MKNSSLVQGIPTESVYLIVCDLETSTVIWPRHDWLSRSAKNTYAYNKVKVAP